VAELLAQKPGKISFDIVGTAIGTVDPDKIIIGQRLTDGDILIGLESNGLHSNGYTLARKICFEANHFSVGQYIEEFGKTLGEELLRPTRIYVKEILEMMKHVEIKGLFHITGGGLFNLIRTEAPVGYRIEKFPDPPPVFRFLQETGRISNEEMFRVFNMGIGFAVVIRDDSSSCDTIIEIARRAGCAAHRLGYVTADPYRTITVESFGIVGRSGSFQQQ
jgi:phosphoribosylformylglycinamidine cyclo-ligase